MGVEDLNIRLRSIKPTYDRTPNTDWTYEDRKILHALWQRRLKGEQSADLAAEIGIKSAGLRQRWVELGYDPEAVRRKEEAERVHARDRKVYLWRVGEGLTFGQCCERLGLEKTHSNRTKLRNRLRKWCQQNEIPYPGRKSADERNAKVLAMRQEGKSYFEIADELGLDRTPQVRRTLCSSLRYYCQKKGLEYPRKPR